MMIGFALSQGSVSFVPIENTESGDSYSVLDDGASITFTGTGGQFLGVSATVPKTSLAVQPVPFGAPNLLSDGTPAVGETLTIEPVPLWFFDTARGMPSIDYVATGSNAVQGTNLLLAEADAGNEVTVTERASYDGANFGTALSNAVSVADVSAPAPVPPSMFDISLFSLVDNANVTFSLVINGLPNDGGAQISGVEYSTDNADTWAAVPSYAGAGSYDIGLASDGSNLSTGPYDVQVRAVNVVGAGGAPDAQSVIVTQGAGATLTLNETDGQIEISTDDPSDISITISGNPAYNGVYVVNQSELDLGPVNLVPAAISYTDAAETELAYLAGLWITDEAALNVDINWQSNGADILNANTPNLILTGADAGMTISMRETATDANGARVASSNEIAVPGSGIDFSTTFAQAFDPLSLSDDFESAELISDRVLSDGTVARPASAGAQEQVLATLELPQAQFTEWRFANLATNASAQYRHVFRATRTGRYLFVRHTADTLRDLRIQIAGGSNFRIGASIDRLLQADALYRAEVTEDGVVTLSEDGVAFFSVTLSAGDNHVGNGAGLYFRPTGQDIHHTISYFRAGALA